MGGLGSLFSAGVSALASALRGVQVGGGLIFLKL